jgi:hypothetical protein
VRGAVPWGTETRPSPQDGGLVPGATADMFRLADNSENRAAESPRRPVCVGFALWRSKPEPDDVGLDGAEGDDDTVLDVMTILGAVGCAPNLAELSGAGCRAERRLCGELRYVECTGLAAGARRGNKNAVKHGAMVAESIALRREVQTLARMTRETMAAIG